METRRQSHCVYRCEYHIVWIPRFRYKILRPGVAEYLSIKLKEIRKFHPEIEFIEQNIRPDHIHLVLNFPPKYSVSKVVNLLKSNTSKALRNKFEFIREIYRGDTTVWSVGYFVATVGLNEKTIINYVKYQSEEDSGQAKLDLG